MEYEKEIDDYVLIQYIILFVLSQAGSGVSYDLLINIITEHANINYLEFQLALDNLKCSEYVKIYIDDTERTFYEITDKGETASKLVEKDIPVYIREPIRKSVEPSVQNDKINHMVRVRVRSLDENIHYADCSVYDDDDTLLMKISVFSPTRDEAVNITKKFKENPEKMYAKLISAVAD